MSNLPAPRYSLLQAVSTALAVATRAIEEVRALAREPGPKGERGERGEKGAAGSVAGVIEWIDGVHYEGDVRTFDGSTYQALRDTAKAPPNEDWHCIAAAGRDGSDGRSFLICGTYDPDRKDYPALSVVALNGASFAARRDNPGPCPGDGWQLIAAQGKRGEKGERGEKSPKGEKGDKGDAGSAVVALAISEDAVLTLTNGDGTTVELDLYPVLCKVV